jgi:hypothetical protein
VLGDGRRGLCQGEPDHPILAADLKLFLLREGGSVDMSPSVEEYGDCEIRWFLCGAYRSKLFIGDCSGSSENWAFGA